MTQLPLGAAKKRAVEAMHRAVPRTRAMSISERFAARRLCLVPQLLEHG